MPGPEAPLYIRGARLDATYPVSIPMHGHALNITCQSYADRLCFGFIGCRDTLPHLQRLAVYCGESLAELEAVFDVPVRVSAILGRARLNVRDLLQLGPGTVLELDRKVGEAIDIYVNDRLVARGEVVLVEDKLGVTMTEIVKAER